MKLTAPTKPVWIITTILGVLGVASHWVAIPVVTPNQFWFLMVAWLVLTLATLLKGI